MYVFDDLPFDRRVNLGVECQGHALEEGQGHFSSIVCQYVNIPGPRSCIFLMLGSKCMFLMIGYLTEE